MRRMIAISLLATCAAVNAQHDTPASVLLFPLIRSSGEFLTAVSITNTDVTPTTLTSYGGGTAVGFQYVNVAENPLDQFRPLACTVFDRVEYLTPADTLTVMTYCHNAPMFGHQGYLVAFASNPELYRTPWSHEALIGSSVHVKLSGAAYMMPAYPIHTDIAHHLATDINGNRQLDLDGIEYLPVPDVFYVNAAIPCFDDYLTVVSLTGNDMDVHTLYFAIWNDNEFPLSATLQFNCWFEAPLWAVSPVFTEQFLDSLPNDRREIDINCDGSNDIEGAWCIIQSLGVSNHTFGPISRDGAFIAHLTGHSNHLSVGHPLFESVLRQTNGTIPIR